MLARIVSAWVWQVTTRLSVPRFQGLVLVCIGPLNPRTARSSDCDDWNLELGITTSKVARFRNLRCNFPPTSG
jgi:hypothetical protein